jgi:hypothetical protein
LKEQKIRKVNAFALGSGRAALALFIQTGENDMTPVNPDWAMEDMPIVQQPRFYLNLNKF